MTRSARGPLFLGTQADNEADKVSKGRQAKGTTHGAFLQTGRWPRGEAHWRNSTDRGKEHLRGASNPNSTITEDDVRAIRELSRAGLYPPTIAKMIGTTKTVVYNILKGATWKHVKDEE